MIANETEYRNAVDEVQSLEDWLRRLKRESTRAPKLHAQAGVRKMIARLQEELALYEGRRPT